MDRRSLISGALGGAAGVVVGRELAPTGAGAAADVDRSEFEALKARVAYLEGFHPPMPTTTTAPPYVPTFSGSVSIPAGFVVPFGEVWDFDPSVSTIVEVGANVVVAGTLRMRPANPGVVHTLRFVGVNESAFVGGGMDPIPTDVGLWVVGAGKLDLSGAAKTAWSRAAGSIAAGATTVTLTEAPTGWQVGDTVTITPTVAPTVSNFATRYDTATISAISGATITLSNACANAHPAVTVGPGMAPIGAEVLNLTRNVRLEGTPTGRSHGWITSSQPSTVDYVQFRHMGPRKNTGRVTYYGPVTAAVLGRYPLHFHMCENGSVGTSVKGSVVWQSGARAFVPHESNGITFDACIAHDVMDEPYWWDGAPNPSTPSSMSDDIVWRKCVASLVKVDPDWEGYRLAGFVLGAGARNVCTDCVAVGVQGTGTSSGFIWPEVGDAEWTVSRVVAHNNAFNGFFSWQNAGDPVVSDFVLFHNGQAGINHGAYVNNFQFVNGYLYGNKVSALALHAMSPAGAQPLRFRGIHADGAGFMAVGIELPRHNGDAVQPVQVIGCDLLGYTGSTVEATPGQASKPTVIDFIESGPVVVKWNQNTSAASVIRWQQDGTAAQVTKTGTSTTVSTPIAPFSTATVVRAQPFSVLASA